MTNSVHKQKKRVAAEMQLHSEEEKHPWLAMAPVLSDQLHSQTREMSCCSDVIIQ